MSEKSEPECVVIDRVENVAIDLPSNFNEVRTIHMLSVGLARLAANIKAREEEWTRRNGGRLEAFSVYGLDIDGTKNDIDFLACMFHWFGVSVCNMARLIGFLHALKLGHFSRQDLSHAAKRKSVKWTVKQYMDSVAELRDVLVWRNKIAAHFAITDPSEKDSKATLDASVIFPLAFTNGRYRVSDFTLTYVSDGRSSPSSIPAWSVTEVFEALTARYWPNISISNAGRTSG